jgi:hypothetical protein
MTANMQTAAIQIALGVRILQIFRLFQIPIDWSNTIPNVLPIGSIWPLYSVLTPTHGSEISRGLTNDPLPPPPPPKHRQDGTTGQN